MSRVCSEEMGERHNRVHLRIFLWVCSLLGDFQVSSQPKATLLLEPSHAYIYFHIWQSNPMFWGSHGRKASNSHHLCKYCSIVVPTATDSSGMRAPHCKEFLQSHDVAKQPREQSKENRSALLIFTFTPNVKVK